MTPIGPLGLGEAGGVLLKVYPLTPLGPCGPLGPEGPVSPAGPRKLSLISSRDNKDRNVASRPACAGREELLTEVLVVAIFFGGGVVIFFAMKFL